MMEPFFLTHRIHQAFVATLTLSVTLGLLMGCEQQSPKERSKATDQVLAELGVKSPAVNAPEIAGQVTQTPDRGSSIRGRSVDKPADSNLPATGAVSATLDRKIAKPTLVIDDPSKPWTSSNRLPRDTWEVQYIGNAPIGYLHRHTEVSRIQGDQVFKLEANSRTRISLKGKNVDQRLQVLTIERDNGQLMSMEGKMEIGDSVESFNATLIPGLLRLTSNKNGQTSQVNIEWKDSYRGPFAVEQSLLRRPILEMETRKLKYFDPILVKMVDGVVEASETNFTPTMLGGSRELLEVRNMGMFGEIGMQALLWVDKDGESYKSYMPSRDIRSFRTDPETANVLASLFDLKAISTRTIPLGADAVGLTEKRDSDFVGFRISHRTKDPFQFLSTKTNQRLKSVDPNTVDATVYRVDARKELPMGVTVELKEDATWLASAEFIPASDPLVQKLTKACLTANKSIDPSKLTVRERVELCRTELYNRVELKPFDDSVLKVAKVLKNRKANCVEHALLLAATCRAMKIPSRLAFGYQYNQTVDAPSMNFHAWVEYRDGSRWIPVDSTTPDQSFPLDRIKVSDSSFADADPYNDYIGVLKLMADIEIKVLTNVSSR
jgi:hypothetical protein